MTSTMSPGTNFSTGRRVNNPEQKTLNNQKCFQSVAYHIHQGCHIQRIESLWFPRTNFWGFIKTIIKICIKHQRQKPISQMQDRISKATTIIPQISLDALPSVMERTQVIKHFSYNIHLVSLSCLSSFNFSKKLFGKQAMNINQIKHN